MNAQLSPQEETVILHAREILGRYLNQNPVLTSWAAVCDYCAVAVRRNGSTSSISTARIG